MLDKKKLWKEKEHISLYDLDGSLKDAVNYLTTLLEKHPNARLSKASDYGDCDYLALEEEVLETNGEYNSRKDSERRSDEYNRKLYKELQKKYG